MPTPALLLLLATLLPLVSAGVLLALGRRMGSPLAGVVGTLFSAGSLALSLVALPMWLNVAMDESYGAKRGPVVQLWSWLRTGPAGASIDVGIYVDSLTVAMFAMITLVATLVHIFSLGYMAGDKRYHHFFAYLGLFCFSMLGLVIAGTLLQTFIFWELVGLCSYLLIGFWYERKAASDAALKAFIMNRVGDVGFLIGLGLLFWHLGHTTLPLLWGQLGGAGTLAPGESIGSFGYTGLTVAGLCLFLGAVGKSAQVPLHTWLAGAMEGPTPVSALIHSATMVAAGVYLMGRIFPMLTADAKLVIAIVGVVTLTFGALVGLVQNDIKRLLAYSTMSQLGYMMLAIGIGSPVGALFHLITHAFFKSLLFLGAGSVIHSMHHEQDLREYGGLSRRLPITALAFAIGVLAIAGTPFVSGYYSKSMILTHAAAYGIDANGAGRAWAHWLFFILPTAVAYLTAFYMARCWMLTFAGRPRNERLHEGANESWVMYTPLLGLAMMAIISGRYIGVEDLLSNSIIEARAHVESNATSPPVPPGRFTGYDTAWPVIPPTDYRTMTASDPNVIPTTEEPEVDRAPDALESAIALEHRWAYWAFAVGIGLAIAVYARGYAVTRHLLRAAPVRWATVTLENAFYIDRLYHVFFVTVARGLAFSCSAFDKYVVDGLVNAVAGTARGLATLSTLTDRHVVDGAVNGVAALAQDVGLAVRSPQTGRIRLYVTALFLLATFVLAGAVYLMGM